MDPMRILLADAPHIRHAFRRFRHALRDEHDRLQADVAVRMPEPAASLTLRVLKNMRGIASSLDGLLSEIAHKAFSDETTSAQDGVTALRAPPARRPPAPSILFLVALRFGADRSDARFRAAERSFRTLETAALTGRLTAEAAASGYRLLTKDAADCEFRLSVFATLLALLTEPQEDLPRDIMAKRAADITLALKDEIASGGESQIAGLLRKYAIHV